MSLGWTQRDNMLHAYRFVMGSKATNMTGVVENGFEFILLVKIDENMDQCPTKV